MYLRFVYAQRVDGLRAREGFFQAASLIVEDASVNLALVERVDDLVQWFGAHLAKPARLSKSKSKAHWRRNPKGLSWFKPTATEHIAKAFELKSVLEESGYAIDVLKTERPGFVVYEDEHQIVAEPFADANF